MIKHDGVCVLHETGEYPDYLIQRSGRRFRPVSARLGKCELPAV
jgi:hypothetical protein